MQTYFHYFRKLAFNQQSTKSLNSINMKLNKPTLLLGTLCLSLQLSAQTKSDKDSNATPQKAVKETKVESKGTVTVEGKTIDYKAVAGTILLKDKDEKPTCSLFYTAYFKTGISDLSQRPITFIYNGGPGSASIWLHMGAWGPQVVKLNDTTMVKAPYQTINNDYSLLDASDLVFIDAPSTGFSRLITKDEGGTGKPEDFYGTDGDARAFADFITQFVTDNARWNSPKYLFGESYGTFRNAAVVYQLVQHKGMNMNGVIMLSQLLSWNNMSDMVDMDPGMDLPFPLNLPTYAATAWYHHKLPNEPAKLEPFLKEVEHFAMTDYSKALAEGSTISDAEFNSIATQLHNYTGLPLDLIKKANLRITGPVFAKNLLGDEDQITGRLDSRFTGYSIDPLGREPAYDPMDSYIQSAFVATGNNYLREVLHYGEGKDYRLSANVFGQWDFRHAAPGSRMEMFGNVMPDLARAMILNPKMKVMLNMGYFDLGTPFYEGVYEMQHLRIPKTLQSNISYAYYHSGHMVYLQPDAHKELHDNVAAFIAKTH